MWEDANFLIKNSIVPEDRVIGGETGGCPHTAIREDARYVQETEIHMAEGASLIYIDGITSGWAPTGEKFKYDEVKLRTNVYQNGQPILLDYLKLTPKTSKMAALGMLEEYTQFVMTM